MPNSRISPAIQSVIAMLALTVPVLGLAVDSTDEALQEVIVTVKSLEVSTPLELSRYGNDVEFVSSEQVKQQGFVDVTQALEMLVPGAYVATQAGAFSYVNLSLQGSRTSDVLWTVDGVRINNRLYNGTSPADTLPASMIERMEVLKGGQGLLYGTQAVAGVINVVTRAFSETPDGAVSVGGDSRDGLHMIAYGRGSLGAHHFVAWASKDKTDGYSLFDAYQPNATTRDRQYDVDSYGLKYGFDFTDALRLTLQGVHTEAALDYPGVASTNVNDRNEEVLSGRLDYSPSEQVELFVKGYLHDWDTDYYPATDPADSAFWGYKDFGMSAGAKLNPTQGFEYYVGYDFQNFRGRDEVLLIEGLTEKAHAVFGQVRTTDELSKRARFSAGLRYNDTSGTKATVWNVSGIYNLSDTLYVESTLGTAFLLPDAEQLYAIDPVEDARGNPDLKPEKSFNINLAIGGRIEAGAKPLNWQVTGWKRRVKNLITTDDTNPPAGFDAIFVNSDEQVNFTGTELLVRGAFTDALSFDVSYMYSRERAGGAGQQLNDRPLHSAKAGLGFEPAGRPFGTSVSLKYAGTARTTSLNGFGVQPYGDVVVANLGAWWYPDATARRHRIGLRVENLFDVDYATRVRSAALSGSTTGQRFLYRNQGAPRTAFLNYTCDF
jgi:outer membrane cobalamin receptor